MARDPEQTQPEQQSSAAMILRLNNTSFESRLPSREPVCSGLGARDSGRSEQSTHHAAPFVSAWEAIARVQRQRVQSWWLISQPDHAALSGAMAAAFAAPGFPEVDPLVGKAIGLHDAGWALFASEADVHAAPVLHPDGRPVAFFELSPGAFLRAWSASIERAEQVGAAGGYIVSRHFAVLGEYRLKTASDPPEVREQVRSFLQCERERQQRLRAAAGRPRETLESLLLVLQFCDLLSLYLCCGAREAVEFPQEFAAGRVRLGQENGMFLLKPSPFTGGASLAVEARRWPRENLGSNTREFAFLVT